MVDPDHTGAPAPTPDDCAPRSVLHAAGIESRLTRLPGSERFVIRYYLIHDPDRRLFRTAQEALTVLRARQAAGRQP